MVIFFLLFSFLNLAEAAELRVQMEFSKTSFFAGEQVTAQFYAISDNPQVEVEVVKFPEFKGFWSENQALRQGPIPMMPILPGKPNFPIWGKGNRFRLPPPARPIQYKGLIGSYTLIPMLFKKDWKIEPMKVLFKGDLVDRDQIVTHEIPEHTIKPLPAAPSEFQTRNFQGAVGNFNIEISDTEIGFRDKEAAQIKLSLVGLGNFPEIDSLPLSLPAIIEPISQRTYTQSHAGMGQKTFEWDVIVHSDEDFSIAENTFYFFNPTLAKYVFVKVPSLKFKKLPPLPVESVETHLPMRAIEENWSSSWDLPHSLFFWLVQLVSFVGFIYHYFWREFSAQRNKVNHKKKLTLENIEVEKIYETAIDVLETSLQKPLRHLTQREMVRSLSKDWQGISEDLLPIVESHYRLYYSKEKLALHPKSTLEAHLRNLAKKSA